MKERYYLKADHQTEWDEVSREQFIAAEQSAGFHSKFGPSHPATGGFSGHGMSGRVKYVTKEQSMSDTLPEREDQVDNDDGSKDWCDDCHGYTHMPYCPSYGFVKGVSNQTVTSEHEPAARGGGEGAHSPLPWSDTGMHIRDARGLAIASVLSPLGKLSNEEIDANAALIIESVNQHRSLVTERERLIVAAKATVERLSDLPRFLEKNCTMSLGRMVAECLADLAVAIPAEQRSTSE